MVIMHFTKSVGRILSSRRRMRQEREAQMTHRSKGRWLAGAVIALAVTLPATAIAQSPRELFERARLLEENGRNLNRAVETYQQVIALAKSDRALAGAAQLRIALVKERQGKPEARAMFASVVREYADQRALVATAQARLASAAGARAHSDVTPRRVLEGDWAGMGEISADGRFGVGIQRVGWSAFDIVLRDVSTGLYNRSCPRFERPIRFSASHFARWALYRLQLGGRGSAVVTRHRHGRWFVSKRDHRSVENKHDAGDLVSRRQGLARCHALG